MAKKRAWTLYREIIVAPTIVLIHRRPDRDDSKGFVYSFTLRSGVKSFKDVDMEGIVRRPMEVICAAYQTLVELKESGDGTFKF